MAKNAGKQVVKQAAFLMAAQIISSIIGLLYRSPLHEVMGDLGSGYYTYAYDWYTIILLISSYSIPGAVSKVMSERIATGAYQNAMRVFRAAFLYVLAVGTIGGCAAYFGAPYLLREMPDAVLALRILAPTVLLSGFLGVLRGFFQAHNSMRPTAISQIAEQVVNAFFSVFMAYILVRPYAGDVGMTGKYGAAGGTIGTGAGVLCGIAFMLIAYGANRSYIKRRLQADRSKDVEPYGQVFRDIFFMVTPIILATAIYNLTSVIDQKIFTNLMLGKGYGTQEVGSLYGIFGYKFRPIINIPIAMASATSAALIPAVASSMAERKMKEAAEKIEECIRFTMFIAMPAMFGLTVLSYPVIRVLYPSGDVKSAAILLSVGAFSIIFYALSTVTNGVLQGSSHPALPVRNAAIATAVNVVVLLILNGLMNTGVYGILIATVAYAVTVSLLNTHSVKQHLSFRSDARETYVLPGLSALAMGVIVGILYWVPALLLKDLFSRYIVSAVWTMVSIASGVLIYIVAYAKISRKTDGQLRELPFGGRMVWLLYKLHVR